MGSSRRPLDGVAATGRDADAVLKSIPFFACLSIAEFEGLRRAVKIKALEKDEVALLEEETPTYMYVVFSGKVKAVKTSRDGRQKILAIREKGDFFGEMALLDGQTSPATVIAMERAAVGLILRDIFRKFLLGNDKALRAIVALLCSRLREAWSMLKISGLADAEDRVRATLCQIGSRYGEDDREGTVIRTRLTHQDIADYASVSRETVTRLLDSFSKAGEIAVLERRALLLKPGFFEKIRSL